MWSAVVAGRYRLCTCAWCILCAHIGSAHFCKSLANVSNYPVRMGMHSSIEFLAELEGREGSERCAIGLRATIYPS